MEWALSKKQSSGNTWHLPRWTLDAKRATARCNWRIELDPASATETPSDSDDSGAFCERCRHLLSTGPY